MKTHIKESTLDRKHIVVGWGNGYVLIPEGHPMHGKYYDDIPVSVHGGLTYSELVDDRIIKLFNLSEEDRGFWMVGFDTAHYGDSLVTWPKEMVQVEADNLKKQLEELL